jgi:hypothetical protein
MMIDLEWADVWFVLKLFILTFLTALNFIFFAILCLVLGIVFGLDNPIFALIPFFVTIVFFLLVGPLILKQEQ